MSVGVALSLHCALLMMLLWKRDGIEEASGHTHDKHSCTPNFKGKLDYWSKYKMYF